MAETLRIQKSHIAELEAERDAARNMADVGEALMKAIKVYADEGWGPMDCPSEIVGDLHNDREELRAKLAAARCEVERFNALSKEYFDKLKSWIKFGTEKEQEAQAAVQALAPYKEDAERYRIVRRGQHWSVINGVGDDLRGEALDAATDAVRKGGAA